MLADLGAPLLSMSQIRGCIYSPRRRDREFPLLAELLLVTVIRGPAELDGRRALINEQALVPLRSYEGLSGY